MNVGDDGSITKESPEEPDLDCSDPETPSTDADILKMPGGWAVVQAGWDEEKATGFFLHQEKMRMDADKAKFHALEACKYLSMGVYLDCEKVGLDANGINPWSKVATPWWVIKALAEAWTGYSMNERLKPKDFHRCFAVTPGGRGKGNLQDSYNKESKEIMWAFEIAKVLHVDGWERRDAVYDKIKSEFGVSTRTLERVWSRYGDVATEQVKTLIAQTKETATK